MNFQIATPVVRSALLMLSAVQLNHKFHIQARKVGYVCANRHLPSKTKAAELPAPQVTPQQLLGISGAITQRAGAYLRQFIAHLLPPPRLLPSPPPRKKRAREGAD